MQAGLFKKLSISAVPALVVCAIAGALWAVVALGWAGGRPADPRLAFAGWAAILLVLTTLAGILWAAVRGQAELKLWEGTGLRDVALGYAILVDAAGLLILGIALGGGLATWQNVLKLYVVFAAWVALWTGLAWALRRLGGGLSAALTLLPAAVLMMAPVALMPVVRAAAQWGPHDGISPWQGRVVEVIREGCPFFALLDSLRPAIRVDWAVLPGMYALSGLGQEVPMLLPNGWTAAALYAGVAAIVVLLGWLPARPARA